MILIKSTESNESVNKDRSHLLYRLLGTFYPSVLLAPKKPTCEPELAPMQAPFSIVENTRQATVNDYLVHHDPEYISALISLEEEFVAKNQDEAVGEEDTQDRWQMLEEFGLIDDCHIYSGLASRLSCMTGATLLAAELICSGQTRIAVHWEGGRHHAKHDHASGFCHINDIALAIMKLKEKGGFRRILYIDLDVHHGDGVEEAFAYSPSVTTCSFHLYDPEPGGFFPGTGAITDIGFGRAKYHSVNVPLRRGLSSLAFRQLFTSIAGALLDKVQPDVIVLQAGCDGLAKDPLGGWALSPDDYAMACQWIATKEKPVLVLGGGGYCSVNAAKCWTLCTMAMAEPDRYPYLSSLSPLTSFSDSILIPDECPDWPLYAPYTTLSIPGTNAPDENSADYLHQVQSTVLQNIERI